MSVKHLLNHGWQLVDKKVEVKDWWSLIKVSPKGYGLITWEVYDPGFQP